MRRAVVSPCKGAGRRGSRADESASRAAEVPATIITITIIITIIFARWMEPSGTPDLRAAAAGGGGGSPARDLVRVRAPLGGVSPEPGQETALRELTQDWALACNTKQLDDLVELYVPDATVLRPNVPAVRVVFS